jgi:hypothetical protein
MAFVWRLRFEKILQITIVYFEKSYFMGQSQWLVFANIR